MKRFGTYLFMLAVVALVFSSSAMAQIESSGGDNSYYFVTYFSNNVSGAPDATVRFINDGQIGSNVTANIYVFDDSQELVACGACDITPDGILSEDVKTELTNNPVTGRVPSRGVIKVIGSGLTPTGAAEVVPVRGWATHIQKSGSGYATTEAAIADSNLSPYEFDLLRNLCSYAIQLGSGQGTITCTLEDHDF